MESRFKYKFKSLSVFKYIVVTSVVTLALYSCSEADVSVPTNANKLINKPDSIYAGETTTFDFTGSKADNVTIFTGDSLKSYGLYPAGKGAAVPAPYGKYYYYYPVGGTYKVVFYYNNVSIGASTIKEKIDSFYVTVKDRRTGLAVSGVSLSAHLAIKSKKYPAVDSIYTVKGTFNKTNDTINVKLAPGISKLKLNPIPTYVIAGSAYTGAYLHNDTQNSYLTSTDSLNFTSPIKFTVGSRSNTTHKSYVVVAK